MKFALLLLLALLMGGCASRQVGKGLNQQYLDSFMLKTVGQDRPSGVQIRAAYQDEFISETVSTRFLCNGRNTLTIQTLAILTKHEGNYVEFSLASAAECGKTLSQFKFAGRYNKDFLYLKRPGDADSIIYVYQILAAGEKMLRVGTHSDINGVNTYTRWTGQREEWFATTDLESVMERQRYNLSLYGRGESQDRGPSTASQLRQFSTLFAQNYAANSAATANARRSSTLPLADLSGLQSQFAAQQAQIDAAARNERERNQRTLLAQQAALETQKQATLRNEQARQQQLAQQAEERQQRQAQERKEQEQKRQQAEQKAQADSAKLAQAQADKQARDGYLRNVALGTRLVATKCPDGAGKYYATGSRPKIRPEVVACVDIQYRAYCPGGHQYSEGVAHNFIGMSGCFGDTYEINPKPACKVDEVRIDVVAAQSCR